MDTAKKFIKGKKKRPPLVIIVIKIILIGIACTILLAAIVKIIIHFLRYHI